jgi:hypothetical protein
LDEQRIGLDFGPFALFELTGRFDRTEPLGFCLVLAPSGALLGDLEPTGERGAKRLVEMTM